MCSEWLIYLSRHLICSSMHVCASKQRSELTLSTKPREAIKYGQMERMHTTPPLAWLQALTNPSPSIPVLTNLQAHTYILGKCAKNLSVHMHIMMQTHACTSFTSLTIQTRPLLHVCMHPMHAHHFSPKSAIFTSTPRPSSTELDSITLRAFSCAEPHRCV